MNVNTVVVAGRAVADIELKTTTTKGVEVASFTLAINRDFNNGVDYVDCVAWKHHAKFISRYAKKGSIISIEGRLSTRLYERTDGASIKVTEVVAQRVQIVAEGSGNVVDSKSEETPTDDTIPSVVDEETPF